jgi:23S rRNA pseudouridine1911/1915/1917 synthase
LNQILTVDKPAPLLDFLFEKLTDLKKTRVRQLLKHGCIFVKGRVTTQFNYALRPGDEVHIKNTKLPTAKHADQTFLDILFEDRDLIAISKPAGLLSVATDKIQSDTAIAEVNNFVNEKLSGKARRSCYQKSVYIVHRLDRDVSGVMLFAKNEETKDWLQEHWPEFSKDYVTVVEGHPERDSDTIISYLSENKILRVISGPERPGAREAQTYYEVIQSGKNYSLLSVTLGSGRKHQIRVHLADIGCPVAGDKIYGAQTNPLKRIVLHACSLKLIHPTTGEPLEIKSPTPDSFSMMVK